MRSNFALSPEQRDDARLAISMLQPTGFSLQEAAAFVLKASGRAATSRTVAEVAHEFLRDRLAAQLRTSTYTFYELRVGYICDQFGKRKISEITRSEFAAWLNASKWGRASKAGTARTARALWFYAQRQDPPLVGENITVGLTFDVKPDVSNGSKKFLPVAKVEQILRNIAPQYRSAIALMAFAGVRPDEVAGLNKPWILWEHVNMDEKILRIPPEIAKTRQARILENLPPALWNWLTPKSPTQPVSPVNRRGLVAYAREAAKLKVWPQDALRHSFATYATALTSDVGKVSMWLGHNGNPTMLHRHYRGLATKADAEKFFALKP